MADKDINSLKKELFNLKIMKKSGQLTDTSQFKKVKKQIASLLTKSFFVCIIFSSGFVILLLTFEFFLNDFTCNSLIK